MDSFLQTGFAVSLLSLSLFQQLLACLLSVVAKVLSLSLSRSLRDAACFLEE